ncbi:hypothetical protein ACS0TY_021996 [Phlomoides rotata]
MGLFLKKTEVENLAHECIWKVSTTLGTQRSEPNDVRRWYEFGALASICTIAPGFREILGLPDWVLNAIVESWHNNPHLKRGDELEIKFIKVASEDTTNAIQYPSFHFMKLQRPDKKTFTYIKE